MTVELKFQDTITMSQLLQNLQQITTDETGVDWSDFLAWLERFCHHQGWDVEYYLPSDYSCAIFADDSSFLRL